jgi:pimeloyl-ACP methyl ester carboxylesterase
MKKLFLFFNLIFLAQIVFGQIPSGRIVTDYLYSEFLENKGGENPTRRVTVYLPNEYDKTDKKYPVVNYLHGITQTDSLLIHAFKVNRLLDSAMHVGLIKPCIFVIPDQFTLFRGSFYTNSSLTGNWADFTAKDLVSFIDKKFRTISNRESRGIAGHSMGGHGAIKIAMLYPEVFGTVYALSPYVLGLDKDYGVTGEVYKQVNQITSREELTRGFDYLNANAVIAVGRAFSPNPNNPPFFADLPFKYQGDSLIIRQDILDLWNRNLPNEMLEDYVNNLKSLIALKLDWGRDDFFTDIPPTSRLFSKGLEKFGIKHFAEEYNGSHIEKIYTGDGRFISDMIPFFETYLNFD